MKFETDAGVSWKPVLMLKHVSMAACSFEPVIYFILYVSTDDDLMKI